MWTAKAPAQDGFTEEISATVVPEHLYRKLAEYDSGDPTEGFGEGATYSPNHGQLRFRCGDQWCGVKVAVVDEEMEPIARRLAGVLNSRR